MHIERVQIEEGFLDGFDVSFTNGLNVLIGERGTGKTSLIELIRFCLGVKGYTRESKKQSLDHALSVLGSGQVTVTLSDDSHQVLVVRTAEDESPRATESYLRPIVFSQTEIETVGLQSQGRLRLLDSFIYGQRLVNTEEVTKASEVRSLTAEAEVLRREIDELREKINEIPALNKQISELMPKEQELTKVSTELLEKKNKLDLQSKKIASLAVGISALERYRDSISKWQSSLLTIAQNVPSIEKWPDVAGSDPLETSREHLQNARNYLDRVIRELEQVSQLGESHFQTLKRKKLELEEHARHLRIGIEALQEGAGTIIRQGQQVRERKAQLHSLKMVLKERKKSLDSLLVKRRELLDILDGIREERYSARSVKADELSETLGPRIRVKASRAGQFNSFANAIASVLRGSGMRYNELSSILAKSITPRELLEAVDTNDDKFIIEATGIRKERSARTLAQLRESNLGALATVDVEDTVFLQLLDGTTYKEIGNLSTGQRCTVILPLVLQHTNRVLIVDQPEDHIDNAFITDTLILSVLARNPESQLIFSTHNANIPVLSNADRVVQLGSDGKRGFPILVSNLNDPRVVKAITKIMEGGADAFKRRAAFYREHANI